MDLNIKDTIELDDNNTYVIISKTLYNDDYYFYILDIKNTENFKILKLDISSNKLIEFDDPNLVKDLLPLFFKESVKHLNLDEI